MPAAHQTLALAGSSRKWGYCLAELLFSRGRWVVGKVLPDLSMIPQGTSRSVQLSLALTLLSSPHHV